MGYALLLNYRLVGYALLLNYKYVYKLQIYYQELHWPPFAFGVAPLMISLMSSASFHSKLKSFQYNPSIAVPSVFAGTSKEKMFPKLG